MNFNQTYQCISCDELIDCRIGLSNRLKQPLRFACPSCSAPIDLNLEFGKGIHVEGAKLVTTQGPFDNKRPFVDLHLDFPVYMGPYIMGMTPFMRAATQIGQEDLVLHNDRLNALNAGTDSVSFFKNCLKFYRKNKVKPFVSCAENKFGVPTKSELPQDLNATLYVLIAREMSPFAFPGQNEEIVNQLNGIIFDIVKANKAALDAFSDELETSGFLKAMQHDCLEIYPRILDAEMPLRPVLFLDFDCDFSHMRIPVRVSTADFDSYKDLYKDITEIISRQLVLVAGVNNLVKRGNHNSFLPGTGQTRRGRDDTPNSLNDFADVVFGKKLDYIDDTWFELEDAATDNQLRNSIAHYKTEYDDVLQVVTYYPRKEGMEEERPQQMMFIEFLRRILLAYREMHRMHHLIKALFYYRYLMR
ncbi:hypothetical protein [Paremcibacter congregatus]|uniref:hypothetical protein n=1 Tax=Paremcibacter congregatus TaxID=2043170 RepID=UPI0030ED1208|tara:strand:- start:362 stop:1612 length:1251 start_codon:yes stop_codon:yes gene_type:complete